jgi:hypothetical protein
VDCELLLIAPFLFYFSFFKGLHVLGFFDQSYDFSRKSLSKYLMDTIDFNKHDINIFINLAKIVRYVRHWDESCNEWRYDTINYIFWRQLSQCEIAPIWRLQKYVHFKYITVAFWVHVITIKKNIIVDWILCPGEIKDYAIKTKIL